MSWVNRYLPPANTLWQGRADLPANSCFFQIIQMLDLTATIPATKNFAFALLGFRSDEGVKRNQGRVGAADGPLSLRETFAKLPILKNDVIIYDAGDITCTDGDLEAAQSALKEAVALLLKNKIVPIVLGGGHEVAWGHYQGIAQEYPKETLGIINFDAHFDMRPLLPNDKGSSGTPFLQIAQEHEKQQRRFDYNCVGIQAAGNIPLLFATAKKYNAKMLLADDIHMQGISCCTNFINRMLNDNDHIYLSLCMDVFASPYAPGVSAPQALGLTPWQVIPLVRQLAESGKIISYDIAELSPTYDRDNRTSKLAANFISEIIHHHKGLN